MADINFYITLLKVLFESCLIAFRVLSVLAYLRNILLFCYVLCQIVSLHIYLRDCLPCVQCLANVFFSFIQFKHGYLYHFPLVLKHQFYVSFSPSNGHFSDIHANFLLLVSSINWWGFVYVDEHQRRAKNSMLCFFFKC